MNILILNWRDPQNPRSGGAEKITYKYAQYWCSIGHKVTWISNTFNQPSTLDPSVNFIRVGPSLGYSVPQLIVTYPLFLINTILTAIRLLSRQSYDLVVDEIHGLPFFTPFFVKCRHVLLVCEVAGHIWDKMYPWPINIVGKLLEKFIYWIYQKTETWAISENTKNDVYSFNKNKHIKIIPLGIDPVFKSFPKKSFPSAVFLGRMVKMKGVESAIRSCALIASHLPNFKLYIIGRADTAYLHYLKNLVLQLNINNHIVFCGHLADEEKFKILAQCHFLIHPSYKEGFGLTVLEAGLGYTPTIGRAAGSLPELILHNRTGFTFTSDHQISELFVANYAAPRYRQICNSAFKFATKRLWKYILPSSKSVTGV